MASKQLKAARSKALNALFRAGPGGRRIERQFRKSFKDGSSQQGVQNPRYRYLRDRSLARKAAREARIKTGNAATVRKLTPFSRATSAKSSKGGSGTSNS